MCGPLATTFQGFSEFSERLRPGVTRTMTLGGDVMSVTNRSIVRVALATSLLSAVLVLPADAQTAPPVASTVDLAGPRFGLTLLSQGVVDELASRDIVVRPNITQFGWQFERQFFTRRNGASMVTEWVGLLGGMEQGVTLPSLSWLVGVRTPDGAEFGIGPNVTPAGTAMVFAAGMTFKTATANIPINVAVVPSRAGTRVTLITGFSLRRR
jgi:hypothetical protein